MAIHFSILAWEIPWRGEPGALQSMGLQRVGHDLMTKTVAIMIPDFFNVFLVLLKIVVNIWDTYLISH